MTAATQQPVNPQEPVRVNHTLRNTIIAIVVVLAVVLGGFFGYRAFAGNAASAEKGSKENPVKIGVVGATDPDFVAFKAEAEKQGIYIQLVDFQDYTSENPALDSGELDLNEFQHLLYLANYNVKNNKDLQPIGGTATYPLSLYSKKVKSVDEIKQGDTITIPNDETNQARAIGVLKTAGLIELKGEWTAFATPADIDTEKSKVKVTPLKAEQVANSLSDPQVTGGIINNDYVADAGLKLDESVFKDEANGPEARPYINAFVARKADVNNPTYLKLVKIFQDSKDVQDALQEKSGNTAISANEYTAEQLQGFLADIEADAKAASK